MRHRISILFILIGMLWVSANAQSTEGPSPAEQRKARLIEMGKQRNDLVRKIDDLTAQKNRIEAERAKLLQEVVKDEEEQAFRNSPPSAVLSVVGEQTITVLIKGKEQRVRLAGIAVKLLHSDNSKNFLTETLSTGLAYIRCVNEYCEEAYVYADKSGPSLNAELVKKGYAYLLPNASQDLLELKKALDDLGPQDKAPSSTSVTPSTSPSSPSTAGKDVHVKGYYRKDGTYVQPHTRSAPGSKKKP